MTDGPSASGTGTLLMRGPVEAPGTRPFAPGEVVAGRYRVVGLLGEGASARVYAVEQVFLGVELALKVLEPARGSEGGDPARFLDEAKIAGRIAHVSLVPVVDAGALEDGRLYLAMPRLRGTTLAEALVVGVAAPVVLSQLACLLGGLQVAHRARVLHRDLKPANLFLHREEDGRIVLKLLDFGLAKDLTRAAGRTAAGELIGTPHYMAPEWALPEQPKDHRVDLYSMGAILYEVCTGRVVFEGRGFMEIVGRHVHDAPVDPRQAAPDRRIPDRLAELILRLLAKHPDDRPASAAAVAEELEAIVAATQAELAHEIWGAPHPSGDPPDTAARLATRALPVWLPAGTEGHGGGGPNPSPRIRSRTPVVVGALALLLVAVVVGVRGWARRRAQTAEAERPAQAERPGVAATQDGGTTSDMPLADPGPVFPLAVGSPEPSPAAALQRPSERPSADTAPSRSSSSPTSPRRPPSPRRANRPPSVKRDVYDEAYGVPPAP